MQPASIFFAVSSNSSCCPPSSSFGSACCTAGTSGTPTSAQHTCSAALAHQANPASSSFAFGITPSIPPKSGSLASAAACPSCASLGRSSLDCIRLLQWGNWSPVLRMDPTHPLGRPLHSFWVRENRPALHVRGAFAIFSGDDRVPKTEADGRPAGVTPPTLGLRVLSPSYADGAR